MTQIRVSGTAVSRTGGSQARVGCANTASAAFSHREGSVVTRVLQFKAEGQETLTVVVDERILAIHHSGKSLLPTEEPFRHFRVTP